MFKALEVRLRILENAQSTGYENVRYDYDKLIQMKIRADENFETHFDDQLISVQTKFDKCYPR